MNIGSMIDHTLLKAEASVEEIEKLCKEAIEYNFASVCINPYYVKRSSELLKNSKVKVATVIGFPLGANSTSVKTFEAKDAINNGANEIDMVINIAALKNKEYDKVENDIRSVVDAVASNGIVKVILETCLLTDEEKKQACKLSKKAGAHFVKTSTGFNSGGARLEDIALMKSIVKDDMGIKASGGIRDYEKAKAMIDAGATRIGASASVKIVEGN